VKLASPEPAHLTYCTNIHPGESWAEVKANLERYVTAVKAAVAPDRDFGVGLRLSAAAAEALRDPATFEALAGFPADNGRYVFTINGFPYGTFHGARVKEDVYLPDWQDEERLRYTDLLADHLAGLLPEDETLRGSVSTVPGAFKPRAESAAAVERMASLMLRHAGHLVRLHAETGRQIDLAIEPEPCCFLETVDETIRFFEDHLFARKAVRALEESTGLRGDAAEEALRRHLGVCLDLCHAAVEFEDPQGCIDDFRRAGIGIGKIQVSAGLRFEGVGRDTVDLLRPFADEVYLHQLVERTDGRLNRYVDLPEAFRAHAGGNGSREWRVHFHVPIFLDDLGAFATTQGFIRDVLARHRHDPLTDHFEVETYTWDVLPEAYRREGIVNAVSRELSWTLEQLGG